MSAIRQFCGGTRHTLVVLGYALTLAQAQAADPCRLSAIGTGTVRTAAEDGLELEDGRTVRLAGVETAPGAPLPQPGTAIVLKRVAAIGESDRYGRLNAQVFISEAGGERWLQADLVGNGQARVAARLGDLGCARALHAREQAARAGKLGLWADPYYVIGRAEDPAEVLKNRGRFALVEGKVVSVRESGGTIYVNFGRRWTEDFTVTIAKRNERAFSAAGLEPRLLAGRRVRIRGYVEERGGPWVEAAVPEQIEVIGN